MLLDYNLFLSLKNLAKKLSYNLVVDLFTFWDEFVKVLLKKFNPIHKTALIRKTIMQFRQSL